MIGIEGRYVGNEYQWACKGCGSMLCAKTAPTSPEAALCNGCRAHDDIGRIRGVVDRLIEERNGWEVRAKKAERMLAEAEESIFELQQIAHRNLGVSA